MFYWFPEVPPEISTEVLRDFVFSEVTPENLPQKLQQQSLKGFSGLSYRIPSEFLQGDLPWISARVSLAFFCGSLLQFRLGCANNLGSCLDYLFTKIFEVYPGRKLLFLRIQGEMLSSNTKKKV